MNLIEKEILKYEKRGFKVAQRRTLKHASRVFLKRERGFFSGYEGICLYYVRDDCSIEALRECLKDYAKFYDEQDFGRGDKGIILCSSAVDERLFKDLRKAIIEDEDVRNSIKMICLTEKGEKEIKTIPKVSREELANVEDIIKQIKKFKPLKTPKSEKELQNMLISYLSAYYPGIQTQMSYERAKIDATIGRIGIEIKYQPSASELDRLYGQVEKYCKYLDKVIVVIGYEKSREYTESFELRLKERNWLNSKVFVVTIR